MKRLFCLLTVLTLCGCTSFRTTIMQRKWDSRLYPNIPCSQTKGIPVKLKVPTHVEVTVREDFFMQATKSALSDSQTPDIQRSQQDLQNATAALSAANIAAANAYAKAAQTNETADVEAATNAEAQVEKLQALQTALQGVLTGLQSSKSADCKEIPVCIDGHEIRHFDVDTKVIYTDKVFTVDFKRPAGGVLNLGTIEMDDEQYFRQVAATYEEQTLQQINAAIGSVKSGITGQSARIDGASVSGLATDSRTVAVAKFDISNADWENEMNAFVEQHATHVYSDCSYQN